MAISLSELASDYFNFLPIISSGKDSSEPLQHPIFTFGQLKEVVAAFDKAKEFTGKPRESTKG